MQTFQVTDIQFDCYLEEDGWNESDQICTEEKLNEEYVGTLWEAEDGIRDPLWSRGLGDAYKRQEYSKAD